MTELDATIERLGLKDLFERAERDGLWFWCSYQDLWFSPGQLREELAEKRFRWGADNWELRQPSEKLDALRAREKAAMSERMAFEAALTKARP